MESLFIVEVSLIVDVVSVLIGVVLMFEELSMVFVSEPVAGAGVSQAAIPTRRAAKTIRLFINCFLSICI